MAQFLFFLAYLNHRKLSCGLGVAVLSLGLSLSSPSQARAETKAEAQAKAKTQPETLLVQSTTSVRNSGLYEAILPLFEAETGIAVRVVAVGTGQALRNAADGNGDLLITHHQASEEAFIAQGFGIARHPFMRNQYLLMGPAHDPAAIASASSVTQALVRIRQSAEKSTEKSVEKSAQQNPQANPQAVVFVSRGDDSGTHKRERELWQAVQEATGQAPPTPDSQAKGTSPWYLEAGAGMGATLNLTAALGAYTLTDKGSWLSFKNRGDLQALFSDDSRLGNQYAAILINPARHPHIRHQAALRLVRWLVSEDGQAAIARYTIAEQRLFTPNADQFPNNLLLLEDRTIK